jgi:hypothetical protein
MLPAMSKTKLLFITATITASALLPAVAEARASWT